MMHFMRNTAAVWFADLPADFNDAPSFRYMIARVEQEALAIRDLLPSFERPGLEDIAEDCRADLARADDLLAAMRGRLESILNRGDASTNKGA